jgi:hypothetical protein
MNYAFLPFKRPILFVLGIAGLIFIARQAMHTLDETHPYSVDVKRVNGAAAAEHDWLALRGGRALTQQRVDRNANSNYTRSYRIYVPLVPVGWTGNETGKAGAVRVIVLFDGDTRDDAVKNAREVLIRARGGGEIVGTRAAFADPHDYFPNLALADDAFVLASGHTPWSWASIIVCVVASLAATAFGAWPMLSAMWESKRDAEEWKEATAPPTRNLPSITVNS